MREKIPRRHRRCCHCRALFLGDSHYCTLLESDELLKKKERYDYCPACWEALKEENGSQLAAKSMFFWRGKIPAKEAPDFSARETAAVRLLLNATEEQWLDSEQALLYYALALYLERRKRLVRRRHITDSSGMAWQQYELVEYRHSIKVRTFPLKAIDWQALADKLKAVFEAQQPVHLS